MHVFFSGEGATDFGVCRIPKPYCAGDDFLPGPLAYIVNDMIRQRYHYSIIESEVAVFVDGVELERIKMTLRPSKKSIRLRSSDVPVETRFHFEDARSFASAVSNFALEKDDKDFLAILFRDSNTTDTEEWNDKHISMASGFQVGFTEKQLPDRGIPMLPKPVSEAWLLCAIYRKENPNKKLDYGYLESVQHGSGTDHALKYELEEKLGQQPTRELLNDMVRQGEIRHEDINLPSFNVFKNY